MTLRLLVSVPPGPLVRSRGAEITVSLVNEGAEPVLINRRMAPGYRDSISREIYCDIDGPYRKRKYDRDMSGPDDYGELGPGESVQAGFDLLAWYQVMRPGQYRLTAHYQCDEPAARPPDGIFHGVVTSEPVQFTVT